MNWKLLTDGTTENTKLVDAATGQPVVLPDGATAVVDLHIHQPEPPPPVVPPEIARDLAAFAAAGKEPPPIYAAYLPPKGPHRTHHATVKIVPQGHVFGKLGETDVPVEITGGETTPMVHHGMALQG